jgi:hypothetical protein
MFLLSRSEPAPSSTTSKSAGSSSTLSTPALPVFSLAESGVFTNSSIWLGGVVPSGDCLIYIGRGVRLTVENGLSAARARSIIVEGTLYLLPEVNTGFTFSFAVNLIVHSVGAFEMGPGPSRINCPGASVFSFLAGSAFIGMDTQVYAYTFGAADATAVNGVRFNSTMVRPITFHVSEDRTSEIFPLITLIVRLNGSFSDQTVWSGSLAPEHKFCDDVGGCGLYIPTGITLSMASLDGVLSVNFAMITVKNGGLLQIGSPDSTAGFRFASPFRLDCYGKLQDLTGSSGGIRVRFNTSMNFFADSSFVGEVDTALRSYNVNDAGNTVNSIVWPATFSGPVFYQVSGNGSITSSSKRKFRNYQFRFSFVSVSFLF